MYSSPIRGCFQVAPVCVLPAPGHKRLHHVALEPAHRMCKTSQTSRKFHSLMCEFEPQERGCAPAERKQECTARPLAHAQLLWQRLKACNVLNLRYEAVRKAAQ